MKISWIVILYSGIFLFGTIGSAQVKEETDPIKKQGSQPRVIDFSQYFRRDQITREDLENWKRRRETKLRERLAQPEALESAVDPETYIVGPGDIFSFNVWEGKVAQLPLAVSPVGKLLLPTIGELDVAGKSLSEVQALFRERIIPYYREDKVSLSLEALRYFRVHVVGEVRFPDTYVGQPTDRISEMIQEAGGLTRWAWKGGIELRRLNGDVFHFDLSAFEQRGSVEQDLTVSGGDIIYVPPLSLYQALVTLEGDFAKSGIYPVKADENVLDFLQRIRVLDRNMDLSQIVVIRGHDTQQTAETKTVYTPFAQTDSENQSFSLQNGDRIILPSKVVYVKGAVRAPGAYPYLGTLTAKEYVGMAGGDLRSASIKAIKVYHIRSGKSERGADVIVEPGDFVELKSSLSQKLDMYLRILSTLTTLILAAHAAGLFGE